MSTAISIGNFDAVHKGHQALVMAARASVGNAGRVEVLCFDPLPVSVLRPEIQVGRITTFEDRSQLLLRAGADAVHRIEPTKELLGMQPDEFLSGIMKTYAPSTIVEGAGFRFGKHRVGTLDTLRELGKKLGYTCIEMEGVEVELGDASIVRASSSVVRSLIQDGRLEDVHRLLGRAYALEGVVAEGEKRGRTLGFPTANLDQVHTMLPKDGIYAGMTELEGQHFVCAISVGTKPTFGEHQRVCEVHLIDFDGEIDDYNWSLRVTISHRIREQRAFDSVEALTTAIQRDIQDATNFIERNS